MEKLNMPVANLATGIYTEDSLKLILQKYDIPGEEIAFANLLKKYTIDNSDPDVLSLDYYDNVDIPVPSFLKIKYMCEGYTDSDILEILLKKKLEKPEILTKSQETSGDIIDVSINNTQPSIAEIHYSTDAVLLNKYANLYSDIVKVDVPGFIHAIATSKNNDPLYVDSDPTDFKYYIKPVEVDITETIDEDSSENVLTLYTHGFRKYKGSDLNNGFIISNLYTSYNENFSSHKLHDEYYVYSDLDKRVYKYNKDNKTWTTKTVLPVSIYINYYTYARITYDNKIYAFQYINSVNSYNSYRSVQVNIYDSITDTWSVKLYKGFTSLNLVYYDNMYITYAFILKNYAYIRADLMEGIYNAELRGSYLFKINLDTDEWSIMNIQGIDFLLNFTPSVQSLDDILYIGVKTGDVYKIYTFDGNTFVLVASTTGGVGDNSALLIVDNILYLLGCTVYDPDLLMTIPRKVKTYDIQANIWGYGPDTSWYPRYKRPCILSLDRNTNILVSAWHSVSEIYNPDSKKINSLPYIGDKYSTFFEINGNMYALVSKIVARAGGMNGYDWILFKLEESTGCWNTISSLTSDTSFSYYSTVIVDGNIAYVFLGSVFENKIVYKYDVITNTWTKLPDMLEARYVYLNTSIHANKLYVCGGIRYYGKAESRDIEVYDISTGSWSYTTFTRTITFNENSASLSYDNKWYILGGTTRNIYKGCEVFDHVTQVWTRLADTPNTTNEIRRAFCYLYRNSIYVIHGERVYMYHIESGRWQECVPLDILLTNGYGRVRNDELTIFGNYGLNGYMESYKSNTYLHAYTFAIKYEPDYIRKAKPVYRIITPKEENDEVLLDYVQPIRVKNKTYVSHLVADYRF